MIEFLIKRTDAEWFDFKYDRFTEVLRPESYPSKPVQGWGDHRIEVNGCAVAFSFEDPGIQVCFEQDNFPESDAVAITQEIAENISKKTGEGTSVVRIT